MSDFPWQNAIYESSLLFEPISKIAKRFNKFNTWPTLSDINDDLSNSQQQILTASNQPIKFVAQDLQQHEFDDGYEQRIYKSGEIQTRENNWHDFFNMLVWRSFPTTKAQINRLHYFESLKQINKDNVRNSTQDKIALFDECGVIVTSSESYLLELLLDFRWDTLFWQCREAVKKHMRFFIFGHALYEKALSPFIGFTGMSLMFKTKSTFNQWPQNKQLKQVDKMTANYIANLPRPSRANKFMPLPILGVPDWHNDNNNKNFYLNTEYFRPKRK